MNGGQKLEVVQIINQNLKEEEYINNFNWLKIGLIDTLLEKLQDTLLGIFTICLIIFFPFIY